MWYRLLIAGMIAASATLAVHYGIQATTLTTSPLKFENGVRTEANPIILVIEIPEAIQEKCIEFGMIEEDSEATCLGFAQYSADLSHCLIWVPPLALETVWVWAHEIKHCNEGPFHKKNGGHMNAVFVYEGHWYQ